MVTVTYNNIISTVPCMYMVRTLSMTKCHKQLILYLTWYNFQTVHKEKPLCQIFSIPSFKQHIIRSDIIITELATFQRM